MTEVSTDLQVDNKLNRFLLATVKYKPKENLPKYNRNSVHYTESSVAIDSTHCKILECPNPSSMNTNRLFLFLRDLTPSQFDSMA